jgi:Proto-chlorophyllide reductase 57 kD subunit
MKFLCIECDEQMSFETREQPGDGTFAAAFACPKCGRRIAMLANPIETQLVSSLGVRIGGRTLDEQPMELIRSTVAGRADAFVDEKDKASAPTHARPQWSAEATERLARVPSFVRGMVKRIYTEYAVDNAIEEITPEVMDRARTELGLEGM